MTRIVYEKEDPDAAEDGWVMMVQVHLLCGIVSEADNKGVYRR